ncbi:MAG: hypothetical protein GY931_00385 [Maribacter sp.]|nr:hypothetical protein [Maribacter sp.]
MVFVVVAQSLRYYKHSVFYKVFCISSVLYFLFGLSQYVWGKFIFEFIVHVRGTDDRGVSSLAAEPSYYASISLLLSWLILIFSRYRPSAVGKYSIILNVISIVFLAQSAIGIMYLAIVASLVFLSRSNFRIFFIALFLGIIGFLFLNHFDGRASQLIGKLFEVGPYDLMMADASINLRFASFFLPLFISLDNYLIPMFFGHYLTVAQNYSAMFHDIFWYKAFDAERIMSFLGSMVFELGIFGVFYLTHYSIRAYRWSKDKVFRAKELVLLFSLLVSPLPIAMPLVAIVFASLLYVNNENLVSKRYTTVK